MYYLKILTLLIVLLSLLACNQKKDSNENSIQSTSGTDKGQNQEQNIGEIKKPENPNAPKLEIPDWAKELNLTFPSNMTFVSGMSSRSYYEKDKVNSINYVFEGSYQKAMKEAERIAKLMNIPIDENFKKAKNNQDKVKEDLMKSGQPIPPHIPEIKGVIYSNLSAYPEKLRLLDYRKSIIVEESGRLIIQIIDNKQLEQRER